MKLIIPDIIYYESFIKMSHDYKQNREKKYQNPDGWDKKTFAEYIRKQNNFDLHKQPGYVPQTSYWLINENKEICGVSRLRHFLNVKLQKEGGHIGHDVPLSKRKQGERYLIIKTDPGKSKRKRNRIHPDHL